MPEVALNSLRIAALARREKRLEDAHRGYLEAVTLCREVGSETELVEALKGLGQIERDLGHGDLAVPPYEEAVAICRRGSDAIALAHTLRHLGDVHLDAGRLDDAEPCYREALALYRGDSRTAPLDLANAIRPYAILEESRGEAAEAMTLWEEARELYEKAGVEVAVLECSRHLAQLRG